MKKILAVSGVALALATAPCSYATPDQDAALYEIMQDAGVDLNPKAVPAAHAVCAEVYTGTDPVDLARAIWSSNDGWSARQAATFVAASIMVYCPPDGNQLR